MWVYEKTTGAEPRDQSPTDTAVEKHLYPVTLPDGTRSGYIEDGLSTIGTVTAPIVRAWAIPGAQMADKDLAEMAFITATRNGRTRRTGPRLSECPRRDSNAGPPD